MENFGKVPRDIHVYQYRSPKRNAKVRNNLEKEELLTDEKKKQTSEEFITDNRHERRKRKI